MKRKWCTCWWHHHICCNYFKDFELTLWFLQKSFRHFSCWIAQPFSLWLALSFGLLASHGIPGGLTSWWNFLLEFQLNFLPTKILQQSPQMWMQMWMLVVQVVWFPAIKDFKRTDSILWWLHCPVWTHNISCEINPTLGFMFWHHFFQFLSKCLVPPFHFSWKMFMYLGIVGVEDGHVLFLYLDL